MFELDQEYLLYLINQNKALKIIYTLSAADLDGKSNYPAHFWRNLNHPAGNFFYILVAERKFDIIKKLNIPNGFAEHVIGLNTPFIQMCINSCETNDEFQVLKRFLDCVITYDPNLLILEDLNNDAPLKRAVSQNKVFAVNYLLDCFINNKNKLSRAHRQFFQLPQNVSDEIKTELNKYGVCLLTYTHLSLVSPAFVSPSAFRQALTTQLICSDTDFWRYYLRDLYYTSKNINQHLYAYKLFKSLDNHDRYGVLVDDDTAEHTALATELLSIIRLLSTNLNRRAHYHSIMPFNLMRRMSEYLIKYFENSKHRIVNGNMTILSLLLVSLALSSKPLHELADKAYNAHQKFENLFYNLTLSITDCSVKKAMQHCDLSLSQIPSLIDCTSFNNTETYGLFNTTYSDCYTSTAQWEQARLLFVVIYAIVISGQILNLIFNSSHLNYASPITNFNLFLLSLPFMLLSKLLGEYQPYESKNKTDIILEIWGICESFGRIPCASLFEGNDEQTQATLTNSPIVSNEEILQSIDQFGNVIEKYVELVPQLPNESRMPKDSLESALKSIKHLNQNEAYPRRFEYFNFFRPQHHRDVEMNQLTQRHRHNNV